MGSLNGANNSLCEDEVELRCQEPSESMKPRDAWHERAMLPEACTLVIVVLGGNALRWACERRNATLLPRSLSGIWPLPRRPYLEPGAEQCGPTANRPGSGASRLTPCDCVG